MTTVELPSDVELPRPPRRKGSQHMLGRTRAMWDRLDRRLERWGDWFNPILVKETRQALKSRQFVATFALLLLACWMVSMGGVALIGTRIYYTASGGGLFLVYYGILALPLLVVVPFTAFRSLTAERDENTFELLSISTLTSRQIIRGKLGSAMLQMMVYSCAVAPCLVFTYLLRGVDVLSVVILLAGTLAASMALSMLGLFMATASPRGYRQAAPLIILAAGLLGALLVAVAIAQTVIPIGFEIWNDPAFWPILLLVATFYATLLATFYLAAAAQLTFGSENRSTPLRWMFVVNQAAMTGWIIYLGWHFQESGYAAYYLATFSGLICFIAGALLVSERADMPQRVRRRLPQSMLGRIFLTWFNPGPGTGLMFALSNAAVGAIFAFLLMTLSQTFPMLGVGVWRSMATSEFAVLLAVGWCYLAIYLGLGKLVVAALKRISLVTMLGALLIHVLLVLVGCGIPLLPQLFGSSVQTSGQHWTMRLLNPFVTLGDFSRGAIDPIERIGIVTVLGGFAACALLLNLRSIVAEMHLVREAAPQRVQEDDALLQPETPQKPLNPWDEVNP